MCIRKISSIRNGVFVTDNDPRNIFQVADTPSVSEQILGLQNQIQELLNATNVQETFDTEMALNPQEELLEEDSSFIVILSAFLAALLSFPIIYVQFTFLSTFMDEFLSWRTFLRTSLIFLTLFPFLMEVRRNKMKYGIFFSWDSSFMHCNVS